MNIEPYKSIGLLRFSESNREECTLCYGLPQAVRKNREGIEEFHYEKFIVRFDPLTNTVRECTLLPRTIAKVGDISITWNRAFLRAVCDRDGTPMDVYGFIVLRKLGIAVTGIHDDDESQLAVTAFSKGNFDALVEEGVPFEYSSIH
jgi:hypothetical protein